MAERVELGRFMYAEGLDHVWTIYNKRDRSELGQIEWCTARSECLPERAQLETISGMFAGLRMWFSRAEGEG
jgi:hypothetical protein